MTPAHVYLSTSCLHNEHGYCQSERGVTGDKTPAQCKFCAAPCICTCHGGTGLPPYTGTRARCPMCRDRQIDTTYRPPLPGMHVMEWNGQHERRGPLPARLERQCWGCGYTWDENTARPEGGHPSKKRPSTSPTDPES